MRRLVAMSLVSIICGLPSASLASDSGWVEPVDAPVVDPFRPPSSPWGSGNRGWEYRTVEGQPVRAAGDGVVIFAGQVAATRHVTVLHVGGLRTSYSFMSSVSVTVGERVEAGSLLGQAGQGFHFSLRKGDTYLDPSLLFTAHRSRPRLVPSSEVDSLPDRYLAVEQRNFLELTAMKAMRAAILALRVSEAIADALKVPERAQAFLRLASIAVAFRADRIFAVSAIDATFDWWRLRRNCTPRDVSPARRHKRRIAVLVGGWRSSSRQADIESLDVAGLGYDSADVIRFSYVGGRVPDQHRRSSKPTGSLGEIPQHGYDPKDTETDLQISAARLAELIETIAESEPGVPVDVIGHSQGGVVARLAVEMVSPEAAPATLITLGSPHLGVALADFAIALTKIPKASSVAHRLLAPWGSFDLDSDALVDLATDSVSASSASARFVEQRTTVLSIAARNDLVVPATQSALDGATNVVVPVEGWAHSSLPADADAMREIALFLAGMPPSCQSYFDLLLDEYLSRNAALMQQAVASLTQLVSGT